MKRIQKIIAAIVLVAIGILISRSVVNKYVNCPTASLEKIRGISNIVPVLVIGAGPAGLSAAMYTARAKYKTIVMVGNKLGGQLADVRQIENWPGKASGSGADAIADLEKQSQGFGAQLMFDTITTVDASVWPFKVTTSRGVILRPLALIIATGRLGKRLDVPGVEQYWGKGIGECSICDAPFHKGDDVAVIGGGDTSVDRALQLAAYAKTVYMVVKDAELDATGRVQDYAKKTKNIKILYNTELKGVSGNNEDVTGMTLLDTKNNKQYDLKVEGIYFAIGYKPNSAIVRGVVDTDAEGFIVLQGRTHCTSTQGIFAGGDIVDKNYGKAGIATGSGIKASLDAINFLQDTVGLTPAVVEQYKEQFFVLKAQDRMQIDEINTVEQLNKLLEAEKNPVLVDIYSPTCPLCTMLLPEVEALAAAYKDQLKVVKINQSRLPQLLKEHKVTGIPYLLYFKDGTRVAGERMKSKQQLYDFILGRVEDSEQQ